MLAAIFAYYVLRAGRIGQAADSYSCRDQGKTRGESARILSQTIRGQSSGISIPAFTMNRVGQGANPCQVSLGNTKWAQEILRPVSAMSQPETIITIQQHNTFTVPATDPELGNGSEAATTTTGPQRRRQERRHKEKECRGGGSSARPAGSSPDHHPAPGAATSPSRSSLLLGTTKTSSGGGRGGGPGPAAAAHGKTAGRSTEITIGTIGTQQQSSHSQQQQQS